MNHIQAGFVCGHCSSTTPSKSFNCPRSSHSFESTENQSSGWNASIKRVLSKHMGWFKAFSVSSHTTAYISIIDFVKSHSVRVNVDCDEQLLSVLGYVSEVNPDPLIITTSSASSIIASVNNSLSLFLSEVNQLRLLLIGVKTDNRCIKVDITSARPA